MAFLQSTVVLQIQYTMFQYTEPGKQKMWWECYSCYLEHHVFYFSNKLLVIFLPLYKEPTHCNEILLLLY